MRLASFGELGGSQGLPADEGASGAEPGASSGGEGSMDTEAADGEHAEPPDAEDILIASAAHRVLEDPAVDSEPDAGAQPAGSGWVGQGLPVQVGGGPRRRGLPPSSLNSRQAAVSLSPFCYAVPWLLEREGNRRAVHREQFGVKFDISVLSSV